MPSLAKSIFHFDTATAISQGARDYQEDAIAADFSNGADLSFAVLADGMGGHAAGDVASKIIVTKVFTELTFLRGEMTRDPNRICEGLHTAAMRANDALKERVLEHPETKGMGATLLSTVVRDGKLNWISIGDSPLLLFRDNILTQLNENHSMSRTIDVMVETGMLSAQAGADHPDRNVVTSALLGRRVPEIDCPANPLQLRGGDTLILASDGLQFLTNAEIEIILRERPLSSSGVIADALLAALCGLNDPDLDNISMAIIRVTHAPDGKADTQYSPAGVLAKAQRPSLFKKVFKSGSPLAEH